MGFRHNLCEDINRICICSYHNGFVERFHRTVKEEFFSKVFREKWYESVVELQKDLDIFIRKYNEERSHGGYRTKGRTPLQTLRDWMKKPNKEEGGEKAA